MKAANRIKPWPTDCVVIVAARTGQQDDRHVKSPIVAHCLDCGEETTGDASSLNSALGHKDRYGRPVRTLCIDCAVRHQRPEVLVDMRAEQQEYYTDGKDDDQI